MGEISFLQSVPPDGSFQLVCLLALNKDRDTDRDGDGDGDI